MSYIGSTPANKLVTSSDMEDDIVTSAKIVDATIATADIANVNVTQGKIADQAINEAKMQISNAPTNGYFLAAQSGNTGGLTWTAAPSSYANSNALTLFNASGSTPVYACRAWCSFNGTGTPSIYGSGNVSSITDIATGKYRLNFATAMPDIHYACSANHAEDTDGGGYGNFGNGTQFSFYRYSPAATVNNVTCSAKENSGSYVDLATIQVSIFR